jgi:hypothetical protein
MASAGEFFLENSAAGRMPLPISSVSVAIIRAWSDVESGQALRRQCAPATRPLFLLL